MRFSRFIQFFAVGFLLVCGAVFFLPQKLINPVEGADKNDYHPESFWYYPWGRSVTHKGVDIFAEEGTPVEAATTGLVLFSGTIELGGNVVLMLGAKWRLHYYAHLHEIKVKSFSWKAKGEQIGTVGATGNAKGKPAHLHYSIATLIPYPWRVDASRQGWKKMFYLNPIDFFPKE